MFVRTLRGGGLCVSFLLPPADRLTPMTVTSSQELQSAEADAPFEMDDLADLGLPNEIPAADSSSSRGSGREAEAVGFTLDEFAALLNKYDYNFKPGDVVNGTVFALESKGAMIDIGAKTAAFMPLQEVSINRVEHLSDVLEAGEVREFFILSEENEDGQLTLSIRRIEYQRAWERVRQLQKEDATIYSEVFATNRGGALVRVEGLRGFIPGSHISTRKAKEELVADFLPLKFLEVDEERNRLVLSHRRALVERKMNRLEVGEVVLGTVRGIKPYGAFIDIGGVSGLLHISEISHEHIETPHTVLNVNDQMKVMIIDLDAERGRISLSTKALEPEPGDMLTDPQKVFDKAEEMAARYKQMLLEQAEDGEPLGANLD
jgi:small subunit ribosomal protein S1